jgi:anti-sigma regulatory factor (Ser/Thr protein kinase)
MTSHYKPGQSFHRILPSQVSCVDDICHEIRALLWTEGLGELCFTLELALREALNNAILHGNSNQIS